MWEPVKSKENPSVCLSAYTVGELKEILNEVPDDYSLSHMGDLFTICVDNNEKVMTLIKVADVDYLLEDTEDV